MRWPAAAPSAVQNNEENSVMNHNQSPARRLFAAVSALIVVLTASCSATATIDLLSEPSGTALLSVEVSPVLDEYYRDISGDYQSPSIIAEDAVREGMAGRSSFRLVSFALPEPRRAVMALSFPDIAGILEDDEGAAELDFIAVEPVAGGGSRLSITLNEESVPAILGLGPVSSNVLSSYLLPLPGSSPDPRQYREDLAWALGDYLDEAAVESLLDTSDLILRILLPREPRAVEGGDIMSAGEKRRAGLPESRHAVQFKVNIIELITLSAPEQLAVIY